MPQLVIKSGSRTAQTIELLAGVTKLGRSPTNHFCFEDATISGQHCEVILQEGTVQIRDLGSTNGTFIEGRQVNEAVLLAGQTLHLGSVEIALQDTPAHIAIPTLTCQPLTPFLSDGRPCCYNHSISLATMECMQCGKTFCDACFHQIRRVGGAALKLCPVCGGHCQIIGQAKAEKKRKSRLSSWLGKVTAKMTGRLPRTDHT